MKFSHLHKISTILLVLTTLNSSTSAPCIRDATCEYVHGEQVFPNVIPPSLIVPIGTTVKFKCVVVPCPTRSGLISWQNGTSLVLNNSSDESSLSITPLYSSNISCYYTEFMNTSKISTLQVISQTKCSNLKLNVTLTDGQSTLNLSWSPPCLWPGHYIDRFNISIKSTNGSDVTYSKTVSHNSTHNISESLMMCINDQRSQGITDTLYIEIMAFDRYCGWLTETVNTTIKYYPPTFNHSTVTTEVFFSPLEPAEQFDILVKIYIELPQICSDQEMKYAIVVYNTTDNVAIERPLNFKHAGSESRNVIHELVSPKFNFKINMNYSIELRVLSPHNETFIHKFNTSDPCISASQTTFSFVTILILFSSLILLCYV